MRIVHVLRKKIHANLAFIEIHSYYNLNKCEACLKVIKVLLVIIVQFLLIMQSKDYISFFPDINLP